MATLGAWLPWVPGYPGCLATLDAWLPWLPGYPGCLATLVAWLPWLPGYPTVAEAIFLLKSNLDYQFQFSLVRFMKKDCFIF
jgi:hypothetical protein